MGHGPYNVVVAWTRINGVGTAVIFCQLPAYDLSYLLLVGKVCVAAVPNSVIFLKQRHALYIRLTPLICIDLIAAPGTKQWWPSVSKAACLKVCSEPDYYETRVDNTIDRLIPLLEPAMMVTLGGLLGGLMLAMYLPLFQMGSVLS